MSMNWWLGKENVIHMHNKILFSHKKKESNAGIWDNMHGNVDYYVKWIKLVKNRQVPHDLTYMWDIKIIP
jgi:hypothetical protein